MARLPRLHVPGGWYYLTLRGHGDRNLFPRPPQRWTFEQTIAEAAAQTNMRVHAFCLMDTYARMLIEVAEIPIRVFMQLVGSRYALALRAITPFSGRLFCERHDALLVDVDRYFLDLLCAIHLEPVRMGAVLQPQEYIWSSHRDYLGADSRPWVCTSFGLSSMHEQRSLACDAYRRHIASRTHNPPDPDAFAPHPKDPRVLGDDAFLSAVALSLAESTRNPALEQLTEEICRTRQITLEALRSPCQSRTLSVARGLIAARALQLRTASLTEIARYLNRSVSAVARSAQRHDRDGSEQSASH
jgi:putative transposase